MKRRAMSLADRQQRALRARLAAGAQTTEGSRILHHRLNNTTPQPNKQRAA